ncbi:BURP domain-containing protein BNM2A-like [Coffea eugenioides]|uniref:BURP domain-containing protein BNM2A-like n=1 Tax=Coffea eugenioides TaxID=49369 RepID=UPI000F6128AB|nr:BURP domain-containing protein BNM2A-like [Coffea eugenioides]
MDSRFASLILFLHLLFLLASGVAGVQDNQFWIYDKKGDALDNQFWIYDKKNDHLDKQASAYVTKDVVDKQLAPFDKKDDSTIGNQLRAIDKKIDAVDNQAWIYDGKSGGVDKQLWIYDGTNDAVDNQAWIYDRRYDGVAKQEVWIYDGKNDAVGNQEIYDKHNGDNQEIHNGINDAMDYDRKNNAVGNQAWIYDKHNGGNQDITGTGHTSSHLYHTDPTGHTSSHLDHMDPTLLGFFRLEDLKVGKTMFTKFPETDPLSSLVLLPKAKADKIPFSSMEFPKLLQFFPFSQESPQAKAMEDTLRKYEAKPIKGEKKFCSTSFESMLNFARGTLGLQKNVSILSTVHLTRSVAGLQKYTIIKVPVRISAPKMVACHTMPYPYTVFYCHSQESESRVYKVSLNGENGDRVEAIAVCHMDTSHWSPDHISFRVLGIERGTSPVCHFFAANHLVLVPSTSV